MGERDQSEESSETRRVFSPKWELCPPPRKLLRIPLPWRRRGRVRGCTGQHESVHE